MKIHDARPAAPPTQQYLLHSGQDCLNVNKYLLLLQTRRQRKRQSQRKGDEDLSNPYSQHINIRSGAFRLLATTSVVLLCMRGDNQLSVAAPLKTLWSERSHIVGCSVFANTLVTDVMNADPVAAALPGCLIDNLERQECCLFTGIKSKHQGCDPEIL